MRTIRRKVKGWNRNDDAWYRKIKSEILARLDSIDKNAEINGLTTQDRIEQKELRDQLGRILKQEELKWLQRYKDKEIKKNIVTLDISKLKLMAGEGKIGLSLWNKRKE